MNGQYFDYPFAETLKYACLAIFKLDHGEEHLSKFDKNKIVYLSPIKRERENSGRCHLQGQTTYVIVPSTEMPEQEGEVYISLYYDLLMREMDMKRVWKDKAEMRNFPEPIHPGLIPEEAEKSANLVPVWKLELIRKSIKLFMSDDDDKIENSDIGE